MKPRIQFFNVAPELMKQVRALNQAVEDCGLEKSLLHLVKLRVVTVQFQEFVVAAAFFYFTAIHNYNFIGALNGA